jgi:hypothetical protein
LQLHDRAGLSVTENDARMYVAPAYFLLHSPETPRSPVSLRLLRSGM